MSKELIIKGTQEFLGKEIPIIEGGFGEEQKVVLAKTVAEIHEMEVKEINQLINNNKKEFKFGIDILDLKKEHCQGYVLQNGLLTKAQWGNSNNIYLLSEQGYLKFYSLIRDKNEKILNKLLKEYFDSKSNVAFVNNKEIRFREKLKETLSAFNINDIEFQKSIQNKKGTNYRIDCYIPSLNIAIEYDENGHANYAYEAHEGRQKEIENKLGCRFIRVTDKESDEYNIGLVIKELFNITVVS